MKPNFALHLTHEGITLLHRAKAGWLRIGDVDLDAPDLEDQLKVLRRTASDLESGGLTSKLVIPESQILYTTIEVRGRDTAGQIAQIREGLIGLTPYDVKDLVFDWRIKGTRAQVAVVARDTLHEAEAFAAEFRFNPVSYVAMPETGGFEGEPFFGPTKHAATLLEDGDRIEPDKAAMVVMSASRAKPKIRVAPLKAKPDSARVVGETDEALQTPADATTLQKDTAIVQPPVATAPVAKAPAGVAEDMPLFDRAAEADVLDAEKPLSGQAPDAPPETSAPDGAADPEVIAPEAIAPAKAEVKADPKPEPEPELVPVAFSSRRRGAASVPEPTIRPREELPPLDAQPERSAPVALDPIPAPPKKLTPKIQPSINLPQPAAKPVRAAEMMSKKVGKEGAEPFVSPPVSPPISPAVSPPVSPAARAAAIGTLDDLQPYDDIPAMPPSFGTIKGATAGQGRGITPMPMTSASVAGPPIAVSSSVDARADAAARSLTKTISSSYKKPGIGASGLRNTARVKALAAGSAVAGTVANTLATTVAGTVSGTIGLLGRGTAAGVKRLRARPTAVAASNTEAQAMTVFGERNQPAIGGKPRFLGLMLTLSLLLALTVLALWSTFFLSDNSPGVFDTADETPQIAAVEPALPLAEPGAPETVVEAIVPETIQDVAPLDTAEPVGPGSDEIGAAVDSVLAGILGTDPGPDSALPEVETPAPLEDLTVLPQPEITTSPAPDQVLLPPPSRVEAEASYAATGIWQLDPDPLDALPPGDRLEDVFVASLDPTIVEDDLSDLPPAAGLLNDRTPESLRPPAPLGTRFDFDERGFIRATPEGAVTPDGVQVFSGRPSTVPPARPGTEPPLRQPEAPQAEAPVIQAPEVEALTAPDPLVTDSPVSETPAVEAPVAEAPVAETPLVEDPTPEEPVAETEPLPEQVLTPEQRRLQGIRPQPRPATLEETTNRAAPLDSGVVAAELASLDPDALADGVPDIRPSLRPASLEVTLPPEDPAPDAETDTATAPEPDPESDAGTELAVLISRTPVVRPPDLAPPVENNNRAAEEEPTAPVAPPAPNVAAAIVPNVPARASVAKAATERNAINLSRVNLIGVYGSPSDRRALIRLKSGRYVKVEVGDRVDGGRVSAISDNELLYVKGGRNITLQMPQG